VNKHERVYKHALKGFSAELTPDALEYLKQDPLVDYVEPDFIVHLDATQSPAPSWGLDRIDQINLPLNGSYVYPNNGTGVHVYVIDSGIREDHVEFTGRIGAGVNLSSSAGAGVNDCLGHGTHVSGTIGGSTAGVAKGVTIHPVKIFGCEDGVATSTIIAALDWVKSNRQLPAVVNMSLSGPKSSSENSAVFKLTEAGIPVVVSAGNDSTDACSRSPASTSEAFTVAATDANDNRSVYSNYGSCVDWFAPGDSIYSSIRDGSNAYGIMTGTSMAAPHVTGYVALVLSKYPQAVPAQIARSIDKTAAANKVYNPLSNKNLLLNVSQNIPSGCYTGTVSVFQISPTNSTVPDMHLYCGGPACPYSTVVTPNYYPTLTFTCM
jgi:subtilisin family serine protease